MSVRPEIITQVRRWVEKAEHDLTAARHTMTLAEQGLTDIVCFHCQQCAEKYLKGLLVLKEIAFPKTHDLRVLRELAQQHARLDLPARDVLPLNRYTIEGRYSGDWEPIDKEEAALAVEMACGVRNAVRRLLPEEVLEE